MISGYSWRRIFIPKDTVEHAKASSTETCFYYSINNMKLSIKWILTVSFIFLIGGMQAVFHITSHVWTERVLANHLQNIMSNIAASTMEKSVGYFNVARGTACLTQRLISNGILGRSDWALMERYFQHQLAVHTQFAGMYFARPNGDFFYLSRNTEYHPQGFRTKHIIHQGAERQVQLIFRNSDFQELQRRMDPEDTLRPPQPTLVSKVREKP